MFWNLVEICLLMIDIFLLENNVIKFNRKNSIKCQTPKHLTKFYLLSLLPESESAKLVIMVVMVMIIIVVMLVMVIMVIGTDRKTRKSRTDRSDI